MVALVLGDVALAQEPGPESVPGGSASSSESEQAPTSPAKGPAGIDTPRGSFESYWRAARDARWQDAAAFLDLSEIRAGARPVEGARLARRLKHVLDRHLWVDASTLSPLPSGDVGDDLPEGVDRLGTIDAEGNTCDVLTWRRDGDEGSARWLFTPDTLECAEALDEALGRGPLADHVPEWMVRLRFLEVEAWQWLGLLLLAFAAFVVSSAAASVSVRVVRMFTKRTESSLDDSMVDALRPPLRTLLAVIIFRLAAKALLNLPLPASRFIDRASGLLWTLLVTWAVVRVIDAALLRITQRVMAQGRPEAIATLALTRRALKAVVVVLGLLVALQGQGVNVTGLIAGLGIAGIAISLAAQKTLENVFGGIVLSADQPIRVGDFCRFGDKLGTIEDIGLRSTRVRTLDRTVIAVPNAELSTIQIESFAARDKIRLAAILNLRYETSPDQLRWVLHRLREFLAADPRVAHEGLRVKFVALGSTSLDIEVIAFVLTSDFTEFTGVREDLLLGFMDIVAEAGSGFAFPSQTLYVRRDDGLDDERRARAEAEVRARGASHMLPETHPE